MTTEVRLPHLGDSVTHAKLIRWLKREGDRVAAGEPIAEVETEKTNLEIEAPAAGILQTIYVAEGIDRVPVSALLALIVDGIASTPARVPRWGPGAADQTDSPPSVPVPAAAAPSHQAAQAAIPETDRVPIDRIDSDDLSEREIAASPLARRMAYAAGISLAGVAGSGPGGRITKRDLDAVLRPVGTARVSTPASKPAASDVSGTYEVRQLSPMRRVTAERLLHAKQTIPHFYLQCECAVDQLLDVREKLNATGDQKVSLTVFVIRAAALALRKVPAANSAWNDGAIRVYHTADIALAINTPSGLIAPIIREAERKSLSAIAREVQVLTDRARAGQLEPREYTGGTFTVSNLGMYGVTRIYPIINPPQSCILGVGAVERRAVVRDGAIVAGSVMTCTLSADHRVIDGATGAELLAAFRHLIEDASELLT